jgi:MerR family transcriptional regulator, thiopeptide resistance regulator
MRLTRQEQWELFGDGFTQEYAAEAEGRWGHTEAWRQSAARASAYTKEDWVEITQEMEAVDAGFVDAMAAGLPASSEQAMDAAERARLLINRRFYDCSPEFHRGLGDMYVVDPRFTRRYEDLAAGLAGYVRDAIHANADRRSSRPE